MEENLCLIFKIAVEVLNNLWNIKCIALYEFVYYIWILSIKVIKEFKGCVPFFLKNISHFFQGANKEK